MLFDSYGEADIKHGLSAFVIFQKLPMRRSRRYNSLVYPTKENHSGNTIDASLASLHKRLMCMLYLVTGYISSDGFTVGRKLV